MKIRETVKFFFDPLFLSKMIIRKPAIQKEQPLLSASTHKKINLICEGKAELKKEFYQELEEMFLNN